jgi:uncharacterized membrane protein (DUF4010 family)
MSMETTVVRDFSIALLIGALVGIERERHKAVESPVSYAGVRTFILMAEAGAVSAWLSLKLGAPWVFVATLLAVAAAVVTGQVLESRVRADSLGLTTEVAALAVTLLGGMVMYGFPEIAVALAIVTSSVLAFKRPLHALVARLGADDLSAGLKLLIASFIVLPLLPNRAIDPWQALNPYKLWLLVVLISSLSLVGYVAVRVLGSARGTLITGASGGLVSSTAVSLSFARESRAGAGAPADHALAAGILLSWVVMFVRVVIEVAIVHPGLVARVLVPFSAMAAVAGLVAAASYRRSVAPAAEESKHTEVPLENPFSLVAATKFGLVFAGVMLVVKLAQTYLPGGGLYVVAGLAGLTDVDAITLSMADFARQGGPPATAVGAIAVAAVANTLVKCGLVVALGSRSLRTRMLPATLLILAAGLGSLWFA